MKKKRAMLLLPFIFAATATTASTTDSKTIDFNGQLTGYVFDMATEKTHTEYETRVVDTTCSEQVFVGYRTVCTTRSRYVCDKSNKDQRPANPDDGPTDGRHPVPRDTDDRNPVDNDGRHPLPRDSEPSQPDDSPYSPPDWDPFDNSDDDSSCYNENYEDCSEVADYETRQYPCKREIQIPFEVKDFDVHARVEVELGKVPGGVQAAEQLEVQLTGDELAIIVVKSSGNLLLSQKVQSEEKIANGSS